MLLDDPVCVHAAGAILGESPVWDEREQALYWVDIHASSVHRLHPASGATQSWQLDEAVGSIGLCKTGGLVIATRAGFGLLDLGTGRVEPLADPIGGRPHLRFNDGRCDRGGRFWAGTVQERRVVGLAALYRLEPDRRVCEMIGGITVANGLAWSPDDRTMYFADSHAREIYAFDFDAAFGTISNRRIFASWDVADGVPDGATVDAEGCLWSAGFGGWHLTRYAPDGRVVCVVPIPVAKPTSCAFGGPDLATLYVTSARIGLTEAELCRQPLAGAIFALDVGVCGLPEPRFAG